MFAFHTGMNKGSAQDQIDIKGVKGSLLLLTRHRYRMVGEVTPVNFELRSSDEQDALIDMYESFLNSLHIPLQILIRTRELDMKSYLSELEGQRQVETVELYQQQLEHYRQFIESLITSNKILTRHFYIVIPYTADPKQDKDNDLVLEQLNLLLEVVQKGLTRLGMKVRVLSSLELLTMFYSFYSPSRALLQPLSIQSIETAPAFITTKGDYDV